MFQWWIMNCVFFISLFAEGEFLPNIYCLFYVSECWSIFIVLCDYNIFYRAVRVQILIWFQTFFALHKTPFSDFVCSVNAREKDIFSGISDYFRLFLTDALTPLVKIVASELQPCKVFTTNHNDNNVDLFYWLQKCFWKPNSEFWGNLDNLVKSLDYSEFP